MFTADVAQRYRASLNPFQRHADVISNVLGCRG
jgi:hypothetical protein